MPGALSNSSVNTSIVGEKVEPTKVEKKVVPTKAVEKEVKKVKNTDTSPKAKKATKKDK